MPLRTTTVGAYPKPANVPLRGWGEDHVVSRDQPTKAYTEFDRHQPDDAEKLFDGASRAVVREQVALGIDIPTDGEIRREHYIYYHLRRIGGFDFDHLTDKTMRDGSWRAWVPTVVGELSAGPPFLPRDWRIAQSVTDNAVKITVPGPMTIIDSTADAYYGDEARLAAALARVLNVEIIALAEAGCRWIQIDEPVFARKPLEALDYGIAALTRCFDGVPDSVNRAVHICCGYPNAVDQDQFAKADRRAYFQLAEALDAAPVDAISIEDAHRHNDLGLLDLFAKSTVILGVINIANSKVESVPEIADRLRAALAHIDAERLIAAPDCGLVLLPPAITRAKLENLVAAARSI